MHQGLLRQRPNEVATLFPFGIGLAGRKEVHHGYMYYFCNWTGQYFVPCHEPFGSAIIQKMVDSFNHPFEV